MSLNVQNVSNQTVIDTPKSGQAVLDFTGGTSIELNLLLEQQFGRIGPIQTVFIDLADTDSSLTIVARGTGQRIVAKGRTQGYYNILAANPADIVFTTAAGIRLTVNLLNFPIPGAVWATQ